MPNSTIGILAGMARDTRQDIHSLMFGNRAERIETVESIGKGMLITAALGVAGRMMGVVIDSILEATASGQLDALFRYEGNAVAKSMR